MIRNEPSNSEIYFLVLSRPADTLSALVSSILSHHQASPKLCGSVYDLITALHEISHEQPAILIARPSMLAKPLLATALQQYPKLRLIGWLGNDDKLSDPTISVVTGYEMIAVSCPDQLRSVITTLRNALVRQQVYNDLETSKQISKIEPTDYRLSNEELDALLGAEE